MSITEKCTITECSNKSQNRKMCKKHYHRWLKDNRDLVIKMERHGMTRTKIHEVYRSMLARCYRKTHHAYKDYGARGVTVCPEWRESFLAFYNDMGEPEKGLSLDRIDNEQGYSKANCRWATKKEQANNRRNNTYVTYKGETLTVSQWANRLDFDPEFLRARLKYWNVDKAFNEPVRKYTFKNRG